MIEFKGGDILKNDAERCSTRNLLSQKGWTARQNAISTR